MKKKKDRESGVKDVVLQRQNDWLSRNLQHFSHCQLELATGGFTEVLGSGASGTVYRGVLPPDQQLVAVKRLDKAVTEAQDQEFKTEVKVIGGTNHKNLVKLVGFCNQGLHRLLVYEFMRNGSLADLLFGEGHSRPSWYTRAEIASAVARGLFYLHEECSTQIIHCDIKPQNILLDESMTAKISDFGLAKLLKVGQTRTLTGIRGTKGYCAPEWFKNMPVTTKVDVYSFGILLLELVCCRSKLEMEAENEDEVVLADWAYECYQEGQVSRLVESDNDAMANIGKVEKFVKVAIWCIQDDPSLRPGMNKIVRMLEGSVQIPIPPDMSRWPMEWTVSDFQPSNICTGIKGVIGNGACGLNSYCRMESGMFPRCDCPQGYVFKDPLDQSSGCVRNFAPQDCLVKEEGRRDDGGDRFDLVEMVNTDFPNGDYQILVSVSEDTCRGACLSDCLCDAALYRGGTCYKKRMPMSNGNVDLSNGGKTLFKVRRQNSTSSTTKKKDQLLLNATVGWFLLGSSIFVNIIFVLASCPWRKNPLNSKVGETLDQGALSSNLRRFAYKEMETATGGFKQVLGSGSSGTVYKGVINDHNSEKLVAIKVLDKVHVMEGHDVREFTTEVTIIGETNHKNLTRLVGFCNEGQHRVLVYEFMSNGSLADFLFGGGETRPNWYTRTRIAYSVARGLVYLHEECNTPIIHCDIKPQNILLDCSMTARISDFGLSKLMKANQTRTTTAIRGTKGYLAPEWFRNVPVTPKVDVHSFGIVLLELVCCRKNFMMEVEKEEEMVLVDWAYDCYSKGKLHKLLGDDKDAMEDMVRVERLVKVSIWCIQEDPSLRPSMKKVVHMLEGAVLVSEPPDPNSFMSAI
ncbi:unnamed protein product [Linum tenue]|uniref:non-specific serine/threonine protein kinase n=1 Tax=Linum tenue TaxID=586396 RepID=A0AAV0RGQ4_9ROSI|nr:unnamed protein product [Linum tenue]